MLQGISMTFLQRIPKRLCPVNSKKLEDIWLSVAKLYRINLKCGHSYSVYISLVIIGLTNDLSSFFIVFLYNTHYRTAMNDDETGLHVLIDQTVIDQDETIIPHPGNLE